MYPVGWDKNMKKIVRKRADRVKVRGVDVSCKKKGEEEVVAVALAHGQDPATLTSDKGKMSAPKKMDLFPTLKELKFKKKLPLLNF